VAPKDIVKSLNRQTLSAEVDFAIETAAGLSVSMSFGEWAPAPVLYLEDHGGYIYIADLLELMDQKLVDWFWYSTNEIIRPSCCDNNEAGTPNQSLVNVFQNHFGS